MRLAPAACQVAEKCSGEATRSRTGTLRPYDLNAPFPPHDRSSGLLVPELLKTLRSMSRLKVYGGSVCLATISYNARYWHTQGEVPQEKAQSEV